MSAIARTFNPTAEQQAIAEALKLNEPMGIDAGAGTGKTSTLLYLVRDVLPRGSSILMCVFNRRNKQDMEGKLQAAGFNFKDATAKTFDGLAFSLFKVKYPRFSESEPDTHKYSTIARWWVRRHLAATHTPHMRKSAVKFLEQLFHFWVCNTTRDHRTGAVKLFIGGPLDDPESLVAHNLEHAVIIAARYGLDLDYDESGDPEKTVSEVIQHDWQLIINKGLPDLLRLGRLAFHAPTSIAAELVDEDGDPIYEGLVSGKVWASFQDMSYYAVAEGWKPSWQNPIVMVDEAQDLSPLQRALVDAHIRKPRGRVIIVGDAQQAINAWNGADNDGFDNSKIFWGIKTVRPLSVCWRCCSNVVDLAATWKPGFKSAPDAIPGIIADMHIDDVIKFINDGDAIISRTRSQLVVWWRKMVQANIPAKIVGSNPADIVIRLLEKIADQKGFQFKNLKQHINEYEKAQIERLHARKRPENEVLSFQDEIGTVRAMLESVEAPTIEALIQKIKDELDPARMPKNGVTILTGHTAKGGEWPQVFCVTPDIFPMTYRGQSDSEYIQEKNLEYVMQTRAIGALFFVSEDYAHYDPNAPKPTLEQRAEAVASPNKTIKEYLDELDFDEDEDEVDEGFEMTPSMRAQASRIMAAEQGHAPTITISTPALLALPASTIPDADDEEIIELEVSPKAKKHETGPMPLLTVDEDEPVEPLPYGLGAAVFHKGKAGRVTNVQPTVRRVHYVGSHNPPYMFPKIEELMTRERSALPTGPVLLKGIGLGPIDTDMISVDGRTDKGAEHRAFAVGRWLTEMDLWDGFKTRIRIADAYAVHDRPVEDRYVTVSMENDELMVRAASAPVAEAAPVVEPVKTLADLRADLSAEETVIPEPTPVTPAVMPMPASPFRASGNLAKDIQAAKVDSQTKLFGTLSKLSLKEANTLRELLDQVIEERESEAEPA